MALAKKKLIVPAAGKKAPAKKAAKKAVKKAPLKTLIKSHLLNIG